MNYIDVAIFLIILISLVIGIYKGFIREVFSLASLILALVLAFYFSSYVTQWTSGFLQDWQPHILGINFGGEAIVFAVSFVIIFLVVLIVGRLLTRALNMLIDQSFLKSFNRLLGGLFGLIRGCIVVILLVAFAALTKAPSYGWWQGSKWLPPFIDGARYAVAYLPSEYAIHFEFGEADKMIELPESDGIKHRL